MSGGRLTPEDLTAWAEVSARLGSRLLESFYVHEFGDRVVVTRVELPEGGAEFFFEPLVVPEYPEPKRSLWSRFRDWRSRSWSRVPQRWM